LSREVDSPSSGSIVDLLEHILDHDSAQAAILVEFDPGRQQPNSRAASPEPSLFVRGLDRLDRVFGVVDGTGDHAEVG
jgi:hypothetical protein